MPERLLNSPICTSETFFWACTESHTRNPPAGYTPIWHYMTYTQKHIVSVAEFWLSYALRRYCRHPTTHFVQDFYGNPNRVVLQFSYNMRKWENPSSFERFLAFFSGGFCFWGGTKIYWTEIWRTMLHHIMTINSIVIPYHDHLTAALSPHIMTINRIVTNYCYTILSPLNCTALLDHVHIMINKQHSYTVPVVPHKAVAAVSKRGNL